MGTDFDEAAKAAPPQDQDRDAAAAAPSSASPPACAPAPMPPPPPAAGAPQAPQPPPPAPAAVAPGYQPQYQQPPPQQPQQQQQLPGLQPLHAQHAPPPPLYQQTVLIKRQALPQVNDWNYGLLCCLQDVPLCCDVFCCQVCQQARLHDAVEESLNDSFNAVVCMGLCCAYMFIGGFACCLHGWFLRDSVRRSYGLAGNPCYDCLAATFCGCCMLCQTHRELRSHGVNPGGTFCCDFTTPIEHRPPVLVQSGFAMPPQQVQQQQPPPPPMPMQQPQWQQQQQQQPQWQQQQPWQQQQQQQPWGQQPPQSHQWQHPTAPPAQ